jgi:Cu+-exporting ATPase
MEETMNRLTRILLVLSVAAFVVAITAYAQPQADETVKCTVSGEKIKKSEAKGSYVYEGKTYYFCCENCIEAFKENPEKYINQEAGEGHEQAHQHGEENAHEHDKDMVADPVCGMKFKKSEAKATHEYNGKTYYFCMDGCKEKFEKDPGKYTKK